MDGVDIPSEFVVYPRSTHNFYVEPQLARNSYDRDLAWFDYWLKDKPYPDTQRELEYNQWKDKRRTLEDPRFSVGSATTK
jgi:hypothetical protein